MSAFLGPVHYWLYRKIQYQEQLNQKILKRICPQLNEIVAQECGTIQDGSLEEIIDHQAIHQWLSMELMIVEKRFAFIVEHIEKSDFEEVREVLFEAGKEISINENYHNCIELFKVINNYLIDGMPCDKGIKIMSQEENQIIYEYNEMVHQYLDFEIFQKYIDAVDICLNLRYPYNGETSGSLMRILSKGKAVVVNDIGSFSEIPDDACIKLPDARDLTINHEADNIFGALKMLIADSEYRSTLRKNARLYAEKTLDLEVVGKLYKDVIELPQQASPLTENVLKGIADELAEKKYSREEVRNISDSLSACI